MFLPLLLLAGSLQGPPHSLGHTSVAWPDPDRGGRVVTAEVWYPALTAGDDVPLAAPPPGGFPVLAFGHGYLMPAQRYRYLWEALVPTGMVVALPTTGGELFPDHLEFGLDLAFLVRRLEQEGATAGSLFEGGIADRAAVGGHSMGGGASVLAAASDPSLEAIVTLAAADTNPSAAAGAGGAFQRALTLAASDDCVTPLDQHQGPIHAGLAGDCKLLLRLEGATHCQFAAPDFFCNLGELCSGSLAEATQQDLTIALVANWLHAVLEDDGGAWLELAALQQDVRVTRLAGECDPGPLALCEAGPNSTGAPAAIWAQGSTSLSGADLVLLAGPVPSGQPGLFFYGPQQADVPFGNGRRCIAGGSVGLQRLPVETADAAGVLAHAVDPGAPPSVQGTLLPGSTWAFQAWFRDPAAGGAFFDLSGALVLTFAR